MSSAGATTNSYVIVSPLAGSLLEDHSIQPEHVGLDRLVVGPDDLDGELVVAGREGVRAQGDGGNRGDDAVVGETWGQSALRIYLKRLWGAQTVSAAEPQ